VLSSKDSERAEGKATAQMMRSASNSLQMAHPTRVMTTISHSLCVSRP
jgi:hypothetical protein